MTKQDADELGRRALACKHWRWIDGMTVHGLPTYRVVSNNCDGHTYRTDGYDSDSLRDCVPDLDDPATMGCLLYLVREAWPDEWTDYAVPVHNGFDGWTFGVITRNAGPGQINVTTVFASSVFPWHPSEAAALVAALEAAP